MHPVFGSLRNTAPQGSVREVVEVANLIVFLDSKEASFIISNLTAIDGALCSFEVVFFSFIKHIHVFYFCL